MRALVTGATSGMGREMAIYLAERGYDLIVVGRRTELLESLKSEVKTDVKCITLDLSILDNVYKLYDMAKDDNIDVLINNAGFGLFGYFDETDLDKELEMINLNVTAYHVLTKLFIKDMIKKDSGYILNVCSSAGFAAGPYLSTYYATKNYVTKLTIAISEELRIKKSHVSISALCPGPVNTEFNKVAKGKFIVPGVNARWVARFAIKRMFIKKMIIVPTIYMKLTLILVRILPWRLSALFFFAVNRARTKGE